MAHPEVVIIMSPRMGVVHEIRQGRAHLQLDYVLLANRLGGGAEDIPAS